MRLPFNKGNGSRMVKATINDQLHEFEGDLTILEASRAVGGDIPTLCHDQRLKPIGSCRMCLVRVEREATSRDGLQYPSDRRHGDLDPYSRAGK